MCYEWPIITLEPQASIDMHKTKEAQKLKMWYKGSLSEFIMAFVTDTDRLFRGCKFARLGSARLTEDLTAQNKKETSIAAHERKMYECKQ